jgi:FAD/FMN-containing dehydrogenase
MVIHTSLMTSVYYDSQMGAFAVEPGARLGEIYQKLFLGWGVTIPADVSPNVGVGGHVVGGDFGFLCRQHGLAADHSIACTRTCKARTIVEGMSDCRRFPGCPVASTSARS